MRLRSFPDVPVEGTNETVEIDRLAGGWLHSGSSTCTQVSQWKATWGGCLLETILTESYTRRGVTHQEDNGHYESDDRYCEPCSPSH